MHRSETQPEVLTTGQEPARWSPNGQQVFFKRDPRVALATLPTGGADLWAIELRSRSERQLTDLSARTGRLANFATDGSYLYFTWQENVGDIWVMDVVTEDP